MKYYKLIYKDKFSNGLTCAGYAKGYKIYILNKYKNDVGILEHEKTHVRQWFYFLTFPFSFLYSNFKWFKLWAEVQAYKVQLKNNPPEWPDYTELYAKFIVKNYKLGNYKTQEEVVKMLRA